MPAKIVFSEKEKDHICKLYKEHRSQRKLSRMLGYDRHTIRCVLEKRDVEIAGPGEHHKKTVNSEFFNTLTKESAYFLGFFVADGSITSGWGHSVFFNLALKSQDAYILEKLRDLIAPDHKLISDRHLKRLSVGDSRLCLFIVQWGIRWYHKSYNMDESLSLFHALRETETESHFVRGFIDGDGSICCASYVYNSAVAASGTKPFLEQIQRTINTNIGRPDRGHLRQDKRTKNNWALHYTGRVLVEQICNWIYQDKGDLFLRRKYDSFLDVVKSRELLETP